MEQLPLTRLRIYGARILYYLSYPVHKSRPVRVSRKGVSYFLHPAEGIDFSIYLFGGFQNQIQAALRECSLGESPVLLDVGANIGYVSLLFAKLFPTAEIYSFEPTDYGFSRLLENLRLNPALSQRIRPVQTFLSDTDTKDHSIQAFARWTLSATETEESRHPVHLGVPCAATNVGATTIDAFVAKNSLRRVDFIKVDTDGHEWRILQGARQTIRDKRPYVLFEIGQYVWEENGLAFEDLFKFFDELNYLLVCSKTQALVDRGTYREVIPLRSTTDLLAIPFEKR